MKKEDLLSLIGDIDEKYIKEAAEAKAGDFTEEDWEPALQEKDKPAETLQERRKRDRSWMRYGSLAAACLLIVVLAAQLLPSQKENVGTGADQITDGSARVKELPTLSVEKYAAKIREPEEKIGNPAEQTGSNPWEKGSSVETLPVYENLAYAGETGHKAVPASDEELGQILEEMAAAVDMKVESVTYSKTLNGVGKAEAEEQQDGPESRKLSELDAAEIPTEKGTSYKATAQTDQGRILTTCTRFSKIEYDEGKSLPQAYTVDAAAMTKEKAEKITEYLLQTYGKLMGFSDPKTSVRVLYDTQGNLKWILSGYDDGEDLQEQIVNYNLKQMRFELDEEGRLSEILMIDNLAAGKKIEEYPIITEKEAKDLLAKGSYVARNQEIPDQENVQKAELVYLTGPACNIFMPYYAFDVQIRDQGDGLVHYSTYYVPAVQEEYLEKMPEAAG